MVQQKKQEKEEKKKEKEKEEEEEERAALDNRTAEQNRVRRAKRAERQSGP